MRKDIRLQKVMDSLINGTYSKEHNDFRPIYDALTTYNDEFFVLKDFNSYVEAQSRINSLYEDFGTWQRMSATNIAHSGIFSSDRTIEEYATGIWGSGYLYKNL
ncbi:Glycogen phosphorylase [bioreactor metagenome]|uniref:Glycogen phosphorylase n=1 Tax=bioreactor metagenome TaxID=1076179 RepID=A0A645JLP9_9ZZZZ